jgi:hypothetical protein
MQGLVGANRYTAGSNNIARTDKDGCLVVEINGRLYESAYNGRVFNGGAIVTAPVIFSTAAGTGGPILYNGGTSTNAVLLKVGISTSVVTTVAGGVGLTGGTSIPLTSTTAADFGPKNNFMGGAAPLCSIFRVGTPVGAGGFFVPLLAVHTGALTVDTTDTAWFDIEGGFVVPPTGWISLAGSATLSTLVMQASFVWAEVPV